jgi:vanillate O-demethylase monooxygenase subunit
VNALTYPDRSSFARHDWEILSHYWHAVARSESVTADRPLGTRLLDVNLVIYRLEGRLTVALDRCPHRGTRLSLGKLSHGRLVCPYHGLEFDARGVCTRIPGDPHAGRIPDRFSIPTCLVEERYGLVWVCLSGTPTAPMPDWAVLEQSGNQRCSMQAVWKTSPARHVENFNDLAHFATVHAGTFGSSEHPVVKPYTVETRPHGLYFEAIVPIFDGATFKTAPAYRDLYTEYEVTFPFATRLTLHYTNGIEHICDVASPMSAGESQIFILKSRDHDQDQSVDDWFHFQDAVNEEDRVMVESQSPVTLPLDRGAEWHIASDGFSVAYRKHWAALGMSAV